MYLYFNILVTLNIPFYVYMSVSFYNKYDRVLFEALWKRPGANVNNMYLQT